MRNALLALKIVFFLYLGYLLVFLATGYSPESPGYHPPFVIFVLDTINLFIHEAGHLFLKPFGMWIYIFGGSFFQCFLPAVLLFVTWRQNFRQIPLAGFWLGESLVNVSVYIKDAPYRHLRLLAQGLIHDWNWLLSGNLDAAEPLGDIVFVLGLLICLASVGAGIWFAVQSYREGSLAAE